MSLSNLKMNNQHLNNYPKIYVASLSDYNLGILHGRWIDAIQEPDEIHDQIQEMLKESKQPIAEEWQIDDYSGFFNITLSGHESMETVSKIAQGIYEYGEAFAAYVDMKGGMDYVNYDDFMDSYQGEYESEVEFAEELMGSCYEIPKNLEPYIDYEKFARDLFMSDYTTTRSSSYSYHIFRND